MKKLWCAAFAATLAGCGSDDAAAVATDAVVAETAVVDTAVTSETSEPDTAIATDTFVADTIVAVDSRPEAPADTASLKRGQCYLNSHCPSGECRSNAPGGICACSGACSSSDFSCGSFGACVLDCTTDADCISGMRCTTSGCGLRTCASDTDCPSTTVCRVLGTGSNKYCQRKLCPDGTGCPAGTTCLTSAEGKSCVEDFLKF